MFLHLSVSHSVHGGVPAPVHPGIHPTGRHPPGQIPPPGQTPSLGRRLLLRTVHILLECILVIELPTTTTEEATTINAAATTVNTEATTTEIKPTTEVTPTISVTKTTNTVPNGKITNISEREI